MTVETLQRWLAAPAETEHLEFKEARTQFDPEKLMRYCVALANERGGHLVMGVTDKPPRRVVGSAAFASLHELNDMKARITAKLKMRIEAVEWIHEGKRVLVWEVPSRPLGHPLDYDGAYLMRAGEALVPMTQDQLRRIFAEGEPDWFEQPAKTKASADEVIALLDTQTYFDLLKLPYPTNRNGVLEKLRSEGLIAHGRDGWSISNLAAVLLAKKLETFCPALARKAPRVVIYKGRGSWKHGRMCPVGGDMPWASPGWWISCMPPRRRIASSSRRCARR